MAEEKSKRKPFIPEEKRRKVIACVKKGMTWMEIARHLMVGDRTIRRWCVDDPELREAVLQARSACDDRVEAVTYSNCLDEDSSHNTLRMFWLKSRRPKVYREQAQQEHSGEVTIRVVYEKGSSKWGADGPASGTTSGSGEDS